MHFRTQSLPADDPPHGHELFLALGFLPISELVESFKDIDTSGLGLFSREEFRELFGEFAGEFPSLGLKRGPGLDAIFIFEGSLVLMSEVTDCRGVLGAL